MDPRFSKLFHSRKIWCLSKKRSHDRKTSKTWVTLKKKFNFPASEKLFWSPSFKREICVVFLHRVLGRVVYFRYANILQFNFAAPAEKVDNIFGKAMPSSSESITLQKLKLRSYARRELGQQLPLSRDFFLNKI